jgi:hypothetical protein
MYFSAWQFPKISFLLPCNFAIINVTLIPYPACTEGEQPYDDMVRLQYANKCASLTISWANHLGPRLYMSIT